MSTTNRSLLVLNFLLAMILGLQFFIFQTNSAQASSSGISACANKKTGQLRLAVSNCTSKEKKVSWGLVGPQGPQGEQGQQGLQGPAGPSGSSASVVTRTVTLRYLGDGNTLLPCGDGSPGFYSEKTYGGYWYTSSDLTNGLNWTSNSTCSITLKVVQ